MKLNRIVDKLKIHIKLKIMDARWNPYDRREPPYPPSFYYYHTKEEIEEIEQKKKEEEILLRAKIKEMGERDRLYELEQLKKSNKTETK